MNKEEEENNQGAQTVVCHRFQVRDLELGQLREGREHRIDHSYESSLYLGYGPGVLEQVIYLSSFCA